MNIRLTLSCLLIGMSLTQLPPVASGTQTNHPVIERPGVESPQACPKITVTCPDAVSEGDVITFSAEIRGGGKTSLDYTWVLDNGTITSGQGTPSMTADTLQLRGKRVTATLEIGGLSRDCPKRYTCTSQVLEGPKARKFDEFTFSTYGDIQARLDNFANQMQAEPSGQGMMWVRIGYRMPAERVEAWLERAKRYLVNDRGMDASRIIILKGAGKDRYNNMEFWAIPLGAEMPTPEIR